MRNLAILSAVALLAACTTTSEAGRQPAGPCVADKVQSGIGQSYTVEIGAELQAKSGAKSMRVIRPGQAVTMDYRPDRLNVELDATDRISRISCG